MKLSAVRGDEVTRYLPFTVIVGYNSFMTQNTNPPIVRSVDRTSPARAMGLLPGDAVLSINGEPLIDEIDYQYLTSAETIELVVLREGKTLNLSGKKRDWEPFGASFAESLLTMRTCKNHCVFCFIDQMPPKRRDTLYIKDDDWRRSLMFGQYVTLTNVDDAEFDRIIRRHASPIYISVHATDPEARVRLMRNPSAGGLMDRLTRLKEAGLGFHAQMVVCPGYNDGGVLDRTIDDLASLYPSALSAAVVPVGLTGSRGGLPKIEPFTAESAAALLDQLKPRQESFLAKYGTRLVFAADEFYCLAGRELPAYEEYEDFAQIENGVGLLRRFEREYTDAWRDEHEALRPARYILACGVSAAPFLERMLKERPIENVSVKILPVENRFFGSSVTVSGLLTGGDLLGVLSDADADAILISRSMLREGGDALLDDTTPAILSEQLKIPVVPVNPDGEALYNVLINGTGDRL